MYILYKRYIYTKFQKNGFVEENKVAILIVAVVAIVAVTILTLDRENRTVQDTKTASDTVGYASGPSSWSSYYNYAISGLDECKKAATDDAQKYANLWMERRLYSCVSFSVHDCIIVKFGCQCIVTYSVC